MSRKHAALQRRVARLAAEWKDPHDELPWAKRDIVQNIEVAEDGEVNITVKPSRPHCPCCLLDLDNFQNPHGGWNTKRPLERARIDYHADNGKCPHSGWP